MEKQPDRTPEPESKLDLAQVKSMLDLPATATDIELITVLVNLVANLQEKYEGLLADAVAMEDKLTNRDLADYADVVDEATSPFWKEQLLTNRSVALEALNALRARLAPPAPPAEPPPDTRTIPLRNRLAAVDRTVETLASGTVPLNASEAVKIRNRAHEIAKADGVPFLIAFSRAEKEFSKE